MSFLSSTFKMFKNKLSIPEVLKFLEEHAQSIDGVLQVILNKYYDSAKRILRHLQPTTRERLIALIKDSGAP